MGYIIQGSLFQNSLGLHLMWSRICILTPFSSKSAKNEKVPPKKLNWMRGPRGVWKLLFVLLFEFHTPSYQCWSWYVCFPGQGIHFVRFHGLGLWPILKCVKILRARFYFIWAGALSSLKHHLFISPGKLPFLERLPILARPFHFWKGEIQHVCRIQQPYYIFLLGDFISRL